MAAVRPCAHQKEQHRCRCRTPAVHLANPIRCGGGQQQLYACVIRASEEKDRQAEIYKESAKVEFLLTLSRT